MENFINSDLHKINIGFVLFSAWFFVVGRQSNRENESSDEMESSEKESQGRRVREFIPYSTERRNIIKRMRRETRMSYDSDDSSSNSIPSPMSFHNYAKRRKISVSENDDEKYIR